MAVQHTATQCDQCGKVDTDPKAHWNTGGTYHHDCLPFNLRAELIESHPHGEAIISAAESGRRGEELRKHIATLAKEAN